LELLELFDALDVPPTSTLRLPAAVEEDEELPDFPEEPDFPEPDLPDPDPDFPPLLLLLDGLDDGLFDGRPLPRADGRLLLGVGTGTGTDAGTITGSDKKEMGDGVGRDRDMGDGVGEETIGDGVGGEGRTGTVTTGVSVPPAAMVEEETGDGVVVVVVGDGGTTVVLVVVVVTATAVVVVAAPIPEMGMELEIASSGKLTAFINPLLFESSCSRTTVLVVLVPMVIV